MERAKVHQWEETLVLAKGKESGQSWEWLRDRWWALAKGKAWGRSLAHPKAAMLWALALTGKEKAHSSGCW